MKYFEAMKNMFDHSMKVYWESLVATGTKPKNFYLTHRKVLHFFGAEQDWEAAFAGNDPIDCAPESVHRLASGSLVGKVVFAGDTIRLQRKLFERDVKKKIADLAHMDYEETSVQSFVSSMQLASSRLISGGAPF